MQKIFFEHECMNNIKKIYQRAGKCDNQQNLKNIIDATMVLTPEGVTDKSPNVPMTSTSVKKPTYGKPLCLFTNIFDVKNKAAKRSIVAANLQTQSHKSAY